LGELQEGKQVPSHVNIPEFEESHGFSQMSLPLTVLDEYGCGHVDMQELFQGDV